MSLDPTAHACVSLTPTARVGGSACKTLSRIGCGSPFCRLADTMYAKLSRPDPKARADVFPGWHCLLLSNIWALTPVTDLSLVSNRWRIETLVIDGIRGFVFGLQVSSVAGAITVEHFHVSWTTLGCGCCLTLPARKCLGS